jgi:hypothetical protein
MLRCRIEDSGQQLDKHVSDAEAGRDSDHSSGDDHKQRFGTDEGAELAMIGADRGEKREVATALGESNPENEAGRTGE